MKQKPVLTIPDDAKDALAGKLPSHTRKLPNPRTQALIAKAVNETVRRQMFGPAMQPTFRQRLLVWSSFRALMYIP